MSNNTVTNEESNNNIVIITDETSVNVTQPVTSVVEIVTLGPQGPPGPAGPSGSVDTSSLVTTSSFNTFTSSYYVDSASFNDRINAGGGSVNLGAYVTTSSFNAFTSSYDQDSASFTTRINNSNTGSFTGSFTGSLKGTASWAEKSVTASYAETSSIVYVSSSNFSLSEIEVADYSNDVAVTYVNGRLKFIFGTPTLPSNLSLTFNNTFAVNRFNLQTDSYSVAGNWDNGGYTLLTASLYTGSVLLDEVNTGTSILALFTTNGPQNYTLRYTASSPLDNSLYSASFTLSGNLLKNPPANPSQTFSTNIQLGTGNNQIEQGATGSITLVAVTGSADSWSITGFRGTASFGSTIVPLFGNVNGAQGSGTLIVTGSATGSSNIVISSTASYNSSTLNTPQLISSSIVSSTFTKIRSIRYAATTTSSFTSAQIENLALWTGSLGATEITGSIIKGTVNPNNYQFTINTTAQYIYVIVDSAYTLTGILNVNNSNANDINVFTSSSVGNYRVYRSNNLSSTSIVYRLTT